MATILPVATLTAKEAVLQILESLPDDSSYDAIVKELVFNRMIDRGLADMEAGRTITNGEMKRRIDSWRDD